MTIQKRYWKDHPFEITTLHETEAFKAAQIEQLYHKLTEDNRIPYESLEGNGSSECRQVNNTCFKTFIQTVENDPFWIIQDPEVYVNTPKAYVWWQ
jgi:hypothetical protein